MPLNAEDLAKKMFDAAGLDADHVKGPTPELKAIAKGIVDSLKASLVGHGSVAGNALACVATAPIILSPMASVLMYNALTSMIDTDLYKGSNAAQLAILKTGMLTIAGKYASFLLSKDVDILGNISFIDTATTVSPGPPGKVSGSGKFTLFSSTTLRDIFANGTVAEGDDPSGKIFDAVEAYVTTTAKIDYSKSLIAGTVPLIGLNVVGVPIPGAAEDSPPPGASMLPTATIS